MSDQPDFRACETPLAFLLAMNAECHIHLADAMLDSPSMRVVREILYRLVPVWYEVIGEALDREIPRTDPIPFPSLYDWARGFDWSYSDDRVA